MPNHSEHSSGSPRRSRWIPSPAMLVAGCALVVAASGVGVAASSINGASIRNGTITGTKLRNRTVTSNKLAVGVVKSYPLDVAPYDEGFYFSDPRDTAYAHTTQAGGYTSTSNVSISHPATGRYCIAVTGVTVTSTGNVATVSPDFYEDATGILVPGIGYVTSQVEIASNAPDCPGQFEVRTFVVGTLPVSNGPIKKLSDVLHRAPTARLNKNS